VEIKVLGTGCTKCQLTKNQVEEAVTEAGVDAQVESVTSIKEIAKYGVFLTPAVVINGEIKSVGRLPEKEEIKAWMKK